MSNISIAAELNAMEWFTLNDGAQIGFKGAVRGLPRQIVGDDAAAVLRCIGEMAVEPDRPPRVPAEAA